MFPRVVLLSGGLGGARLVPTLRESIASGHLSVIANTGDDLTWFGMRICPDVDAILYSLAGLWNAEAGWGRRLKHPGPRQHRSPERSQHRERSPSWERESQPRNSCRPVSYPRVQGL